MISRSFLAPKVYTIVAPSENSPPVALASRARYSRESSARRRSSMRRQTSRSRIGTAPLLSGRLIDPHAPGGHVPVLVEVDKSHRIEFDLPADPGEAVREVLRRFPV